MSVGMSLDGEQRKLLEQGSEVGTLWEVGRVVADRGEGGVMRRLKGEVRRRRKER